MTIIDRLRLHVAPQKMSATTAQLKVAISKEQRKIISKLKLSIRRPLLLSLLLVVSVAEAFLLVGCEEGPGTKIEPDRKPSFGSQAIANQTYTTGSMINALVLPAATGGDSPLTYNLAPNVPSLQFTPAIRTLSGTPTEAGIHSMTYRVVDSDGDAATLTFALVVTEPAPLDTEPSFGTQRVPTQTYTAGTAITPLVLPASTGGNSPLTYSLAPNVPGLQFTAATRTLSGTPTEAGIHSMTYRVVDSDGDAATLTFALVVTEPAPLDAEPSFGTQRVPTQTYTAGTAITPLVLPASTGGNSPLTYSLAPNVPGLQFTAATRTLSGTPTEAGIHSMTYRVVDSDGDAATLTFALVVTEPAPLDAEPSFGTQRVPTQTYTAGTAITPLVLPASTGGNSPLTYSLAPNVPGLQFTAATRTLSGTPTEAGIHSMTYRVVDSDGDAAKLTFVLQITVAEVSGPEVSITDMRVTEGDSGYTVDLIFTVRLSAASEQSVTVAYAISDGTATAGEDYTPISGTITFRRGEMAKTITVSVTGDNHHEQDETFAVTLSNPENAVLVIAIATGTIVDDDDGLPGTSWARSSFPSTHLDFQSVAWSSTRFVAVSGGLLGGESGIVYSEDADAWTVANSITSHGLYGITWSGTRFVAVGSRGTIVYSDDGSDWALGRISHTAGRTLFRLEGVAWSGTRFVAVGGISAFIVHSSDGITWTELKDLHYSLPGNLQDVVWGSSRFVAVGLGGVMYSSDGINWTTAVKLHLDDLEGIAWSGTRFVAVGDVIMHSDDGINWTKQQRPPFLERYDDFDDVAWTGTHFVAVGDTIMHSGNGIDWTLARSIAPSGNLNGVAGNSSRYVAVGWNGTILHSP